MLSSTSSVAAGRLRIAGEVLNAATTRRGPVTVRARLYDATGHLLATWTKAAYLPVLGVLVRSPFLFIGAAPAGFDHAVLSVASAPVTSATAFAPSVAATSLGQVAGSWTVSGTARNTISTTMRSVRVLVTEYDTLGNVIGVAYVTPSSSTLGPGKTATFSASFGPISPALTRLSARASR